MTEITYFDELEEVHVISIPKYIDACGFVDYLNDKKLHIISIEPQDKTEAVLFARFCTLSRAVRDQFERSIGPDSFRSLAASHYYEIVGARNEVMQTLITCYQYEQSKLENVMNSINAHHNEREVK